MDPQTTPPAPAPAKQAKAIVAGFGPVGMVAIEGLARQGAQVTVVNLDLRQLARKKTQVWSRVVCGDITQREIMEQAGIYDADVLVLALPNDRANVVACRLAREIRPDLHIIVRTAYASVGNRAVEAGANAVVTSETATAILMMQAVSQSLKAKA